MLSNRAVLFAKQVRAKAVLLDASGRTYSSAFLDLNLTEIRGSAALSISYHGKHAETDPFCESPHIIRGKVLDLETGCGLGAYTTGRPWMKIYFSAVVDPHLNDAFHLPHYLTVFKPEQVR